MQNKKKVAVALVGAAMVAGLGAMTAPAASAATTCYYISTKNAYDWENDRPAGSNTRENFWPAGTEFWGGPSRSNGWTPLTHFSLTGGYIHSILEGGNDTYDFIGTSALRRISCSS